MTDARHPDRWLMDRRFQRLTADQYRAYSMSLMYSVSNRTDGHLTAEDLEAVPHFDHSHAEGLVKAGLFAAEDSGWYIVDYMATQTSRAQMESAEAARIKERERGASRRAAKTKGAPCNPVDGPMDDRKAVLEPWNPADGPADGPADDTGQARTGQARTGKALYKEPQAKPHGLNRAEPVHVPKPWNAVNGSTVSIGNVVLDPDTWPRDDLGLYWRNICEEHDVLTVQGLMAVRADVKTVSQAANAMTRAYPGRRF